MTEKEFSHLPTRKQNVRIVCMREKGSLPLDPDGDEQAAS